MQKFINERKDPLAPLITAVFDQWYLQWTQSHSFLRLSNSYDVYPSLHATVPPSQVQIFTRPSANPPVYHIGERIHMNCTATKAKPRAAIYWEINNLQVRSSSVLTTDTTPAPKSYHSTYNLSKHTPRNDRLTDVDISLLYNRISERWNTFLQLPIISGSFIVTTHVANYVSQLKSRSYSIAVKYE